MSSKVFAITTPAASGGQPPLHLKAKMLQEDEFLTELRALLCFHTAQQLAPPLLVLDPVRRLIVCPFYPKTLWHTDNLTLEDYRCVIHNVVDGLEHMASRGLAHCDIHARNILLELDGAKVKRAVVNDFGFCVPTGTLLYARRGHEDFCSIHFTGVGAGRPMQYETKHDMEMFMWSLLGMVQRVNVEDGSFKMVDRQWLAVDKVVLNDHPLSNMFPALFEAVLSALIDRNDPGVTAKLLRSGIDDQCRETIK